MVGLPSLLSLAPRTLPLHAHVDDHELAVALWLVQEYALDRHDALLRQLIDALRTTRDADARARYRRLFLLRVQPYAVLHEQHPFPVAPTGVVDQGELLLGYQLDGSAVRLSLGEHLLVVGPTGAGKTSLLQLLIDQLDSRSLHSIDVDLKNDRQARLRHQHVLDLRALAFSPIALPPGMSITEWVHLFVFVFLESFYGLEVQRSIIAPALETALRRDQNASLAELTEEVRKTKTEAARLAAARLDSIRIAWPHLVASKRNLWEHVRDTSLYIGIDGPFLPAHRFLVWLLVYVRWCQLRTISNRSPHTTVILDEGDTSLHRDAPHSPTGAPSIAVNAVFRMREAGISFFVGSPTWALVHEALANFPNTIALRPNPAEASRAAHALHLSEQQLRYVLAMPMGTALGNFRRAPHNTIITIPHTSTEKNPPRDMLAAARQRSAAFTATAPSEEAPREQRDTPTPPSAPPPPVTAADELVAPVPGTSQRVALGEHTARLLADVADHPYTLCTPSYRRCHLRLSEGERAREQAQGLQLLAADRVTTGRGRGKTGISIHLTPAGWAWLGRTPVKGLRGGGSASHSYCVYELARRIPGARIEEMLGTGKSVDLCLAFSVDQHEPLYRAISALTGKTPRLREGEIIAIEIDLSLKTARHNASKNAAAGIALTILAINDRTPEQRAHLFTPSTIVVDVYALLDALGER